MRVVHVDHSVENGGAEFALSRLLEKSQGRWHATLYAPSASGPFQNLGVPVARMRHQHVAGATGRPGPRALAAMGKAVLAEAVALRRTPAFRDADVVHANTTRAGLICALACVGTDKRLVLSVRDIISDEALGRRTVAMFGWAIKQADGVIANSSSTLASVERFLGKNVAAGVIHSPLGQRYFAPISMPAERGQVHIGALARLDPWKGQRELIRAFAELAPEFPTIRLLIAGEAAFGHQAYADELRGIVEACGLSDRVRFLGHVEDTVDFVDVLDIAVQCSLRPEPLGQNVLQYLARGRAVVAANVGGPAEWIEDGVNGLLFELGSAEDLARCLKDVVVDTSLRLRLMAGARHTDLLDDDEVAVRHENFFRTAGLS